MFTKKLHQMNKKQRRGFTVAEMLFSIVCVSMLLATIISVTVYLRSTAYTERAEASIETFVISIAETISQDLEDGVDITDVDYNSDPRFNNNSIYKNIVVDWQEDVFGETLYWVKVNFVYKATNTKQTCSFFLRGGN